MLGMRPKFIGLMDINNVALLKHRTPINDLRFSMDYKKQHKVKTIIFAACIVLFAATFGFIQWNRNKLKEMMPVVGKVSGAFFLDRQEYCVGEPIVVTFYAINGMNYTYSFDVGGDYRNGDGGFRHERYSFEVTNHSGRSFTKKGECVGGLGQTITLKPGEIYVSYQLAYIG